VGWQELKDMFRQAGGILRADIPLDHQGRSKGFGTVVMSSVDEARKAVEIYHDYEWNGRKIEVREDRSPSSLSPRYSQPHSHHPQPMHHQHPQPHPYLHQNHYHSPQQSSRGYHYNSSYSNTNSSSYHQQQHHHYSPPTPPGCLLYVGNLPFSIQWQELKDLFKQAGVVIRADIAQDNQGRSRGFGSIVMATSEEAQTAIRILNGTEIQGRVIEVREDKFAAQKPNTSPVNSYPSTTTNTTTTPGMNENGNNGYHSGPSSTVGARHVAGPIVREPGTQVFVGNVSVIWMFLYLFI